MGEAALDIVVVDDDDIVPELVANALAPCAGSYRVLAAEDGAAGLELLRERRASGPRRPHLVLLDLNMPRMNGMEFLDALRADPLLRGTVVFVLSTSDTELDRARAYDRQVAGYLVKSRQGPQLRELAGLVDAYRKAVLFPG
ncbi:MAG: response regulator [Erythrobacter sp.]|nr:response regulator [Erythrobacter sp.]